MKKKTNWTKIIYIIGIFALILGVIDAMEGSVVILAGCFLIALSTFLTRDRYWKIFIISAIMIAVGVFFLFYLSSLGGFGGTSKLSIWWGLLIVPYPIGWLLSISLLIAQAINNMKQKAKLNK
jgi:hypothetical protein